MLHFFSVRFIVHSSCDDELKIWENFLYFFTFFINQFFKIHDKPRRNTRNQSHILVFSLFHYFIHLGFPVLYAVGFIGRQSVFLKIIWDVMRHNSRKPARFDAVDFFQLWRTLQENHFPCHKICIVFLGNIMEYRRLCSCYLVRHSLL